MVETYKDKTEKKGKPEKEDFLRLQKRMARRARKQRILTEKDVDRLVFEDR